MLDYTKTLAAFYYRSKPFGPYPSRVLSSAIRFRNLSNRNGSSLRAKRRGPSSAPTFEIYPEEDPEAYTRPEDGAAWGDPYNKPAHVWYLEDVVNEVTTGTFSTMYCVKRPFMHYVVCQTLLYTLYECKTRLYALYRVSNALAYTI